MNAVFSTLLNVVVPMLSQLKVSGETLLHAARKGADAFLDVIEEHIDETPNEIDNAVIGGAINVARSLIGIAEQEGSEFAD